MSKKVRFIAQFSHYDTIEKSLFIQGFSPDNPEEKRGLFLPKNFLDKGLCALTSVYKDDQIQPALHTSGSPKNSGITPIKGALIEAEKTEDNILMWASINNKIMCALNEQQIEQMRSKRAKREKNTPTSTQALNRFRQRDRNH